jgi:hypothetical protein
MCVVHALQLPDDALPAPLPQVSVVKEVVRALVVLRGRLASEEPLQRLLAMWGNQGLHLSARVVIVKELSGLFEEPRVAQVGRWGCQGCCCCPGLSGLLLPVLLRAAAQEGCC